MNKRILYVEDNFNNMLLVKRIVEAEGHAFLTTAEGEDGWRLAYEEQPDLIFVDLLLAGTIDGFELLRRLKKTPSLERIPVIILTAYGHGEIEERARYAGCDGFLHKPADIRQIRDIIRHFLGDPIRKIRLEESKKWPVFAIPQPSVGSSKIQSGD